MASAMNARGGDRFQIDRDGYVVCVCLWAHTSVRSTTMKVRSAVRAGNRVQIDRDG